MSVVYLSLGSNMGDRLENLSRARSLLEENGIRVMRLSPVYETEAMTQPGQTAPKFLNAVWEIETDREPEDLLDLLKSMERKMGRSGKGDWAPRVIDFDILFYDDLIMDTPRLKIPHPEMSRREFVLKPLSDLAPGLVHPVFKKTIKEILCNFSSTPRT